MKSLKNPVLRIPLLLPLIGILTSAAFALSFRGQADEPGFSGAYSCQVSASLGKKN